jgi:ATP-dependent RNA helicase RhlB
VVTAPTPGLDDAERAPRKRRRRRGGKRVEGNGEAAAVSAPAQQGGKATQVHAQKPPKAAVSGEKPGLLNRIGRSLKSLITRAPRSQH